MVKVKLMLRCSLNLPRFASKELRRLPKTLLAIGGELRVCESGSEPAYTQRRGCVPIDDF